MKNGDDADRILLLWQMNFFSICAACVCGIVHRPWVPIMSNKNLLIVAHAPSPNTARLLASIVRGATNPDITGVDIVAKNPFDTDTDDVMAAHGIILGTTENLGYMSGALKDFFDRIYYPCLEIKQGTPYALYVRAGHDGTGTRRGVEAIVAGRRWRAVQ